MQDTPELFVPLRPIDEKKVVVAIKREFETPAVEELILSGKLDRVLYEEETIDISREKAEELASKFNSGLLTPSGQREHAALLRAFIYRNYEVPVDIDGDGVPDAPSSTARKSWLRRVFRKDDFDSA